MTVIKKENIFNMSTEEWLKWLTNFNVVWTNSFKESNKYEIHYTECKRCGANKIENIKCEYCGQ